MTTNYLRGHRLPKATCGAIRRANGDEWAPHSTHTMKSPLTGYTEFDNACVKCKARMWGSPGSWDYDTALEHECNGKDRHG